MFGGTTRPHCLLNADARRELPTRRQRASPPRLGRECPVRAAKRFSACDRFSLPDAFCAGVVLPHGRLPHYSRFRLKSQRRNRRKTGGVGSDRRKGASKAGQRVQGAACAAARCVPRIPGAFCGQRRKTRRKRSATRAGGHGSAASAVGRPPPYCGCVSRIPGAFCVSRTCSGAGQGRRAYRHPPHCGARRPTPRRSVFACGFWQLKRPGSTPRPFFCSFERTAGNRAPA